MWARGMVEGAGFEPAKPFQATDLQSVGISRSPTPPGICPEPESGFEPLTCLLQIGCAAVALLGLIRPFSKLLKFTKYISINVKKFKVKVFCISKQFPAECPQGLHLVA